MTTIIRLTRPPGQNDPNGTEEVLLEGDIEDTSVYTEAQDLLTKLHEEKND